jgi:superfamily II DNA or RNA helicase
MKLRDYQIDLVRRIQKAMGEGSKRPLAVLPTGGGKTVIFCYLSQFVAKRGKRVLIMVHRVELIRQTCKALEKFGVSYGVIHSAFTPNPQALVQVASIQTLSARLHLIRRDFSLMIVDEAHHATASTWSYVINSMPASCYLLGVTATPCRGDGTGLGLDAGGIFDTMVEGPQIYELIRQGHLVEPEVYAPTQNLDMTALRKLKDSEKRQMESLMSGKSLMGDAIAHYRKYANGQPAVAFCVSVRHAELVAEQFREAGYRSSFVDGKMDDDTRKRTLDGLATGEMQVVTSCDLISEGFDIPAIACGILLRQTKSLGMYLQQVGRVLRPSAGKSSAIILDHAGNSLLHGLPSQHREWELGGDHRKSKGQGSDQEVKAPQIRQCERCYHVFVYNPEDLACPSCKHLPVAKAALPKTQEGELRKLTRAEREAVILEAQAKARRQVHQENGPPQNVDELLEVALLCEYQFGYVVNAARSKGWHLTPDHARKFAARRGYKAGWVTRQTDMYQLDYPSR